MRGHHFEVISVGKRSLAPQTKTTSLIAIVLLRGIAIGAVDQAHVVMVDAFTEILDDERVICQGDLDGTMWAACFDVGIPGIAKHFTHHSQDLILVERTRQDVEELGTAGDTELDGLLATNDGMGNVVVLMGNLHGDLSEKEKATRRWLLNLLNSC